MILIVDTPFQIFCFGRVVMQQHKKELTHVEREIYQVYKQGFTTSRQVADRTGRTASTAHYILANLRRKNWIL